MITSESFTKEELQKHLSSNGVTAETGQLVELFCKILDQTAAARTSSSSQTQQGAAPVEPQPDAVMVEIDGSTDEEAEPDQGGRRPRKAGKKVTKAAAEEIKRRRITKKTATKNDQ